MQEVSAARIHGGVHRFYAGLLGEPAVDAAQRQRAESEL
jgi:hypothetical protein